MYRAGVPPSSSKATQDAAPGMSSWKPLTTTDIDGIRVHDSGSGERATVLLHGLGNSLDYWTAVSPLLSTSRRVIAPDIPGFGLSRRPRPFDLDSISGSILQTLLGLGISEFELVGHSMGGLVALAIAAAHPTRVARLSLLDACIPTAVSILNQPAKALQHLGIAANLFAQFAGGLIPLGRVGAEALGRSADLRAIALWPFVHRPRLLQGELVAIALRNNGGLGGLDAARIASSVDYMKLLAGVAVPTYLLSGAHDRLIHGSDACVCSEVLDVRSAILLSDCGHWPMLEFPRATAEFLLG